MRSAVVCGFQTYRMRDDRRLFAVLQGGGTREGSGKCSCNFGYQGELCTECMDEFFAEVRNETHTICQRKSLCIIDML